MAAGVDVPKKVFAHGWLLVGGEKMSKSKATAIAPGARSSTLRVRRLPLLLHQDDRVRVRRQLLLGAHVRRLHQRAGQRARQPRVARHRHGRQVLRRRTARSRRRQVRPSRRWPDALRRRRRPPTRRSSGSRSTRRSRAAADFVSTVNGYVTEQEPWKVAKDDSDRGPSAAGDDPVRRRRVAARGRGAAQRGDAEDVGRAVVRPRRARRSGRWPTSASPMSRPGA